MTPADEGRGTAIRRRGAPTKIPIERKTAAPAVKNAGGSYKDERAARRMAVVMPILDTKRWKPGRLASEAGVGKNSVYEYLDGTRRKITGDNRKALAQALDLKPEQLPD